MNINWIIDEYQADDFTPTLRQIYYQLVQANVIPNTPTSYDNLGVLIKKGRLMGLISWDAIEDRNRGINNWLIQPSQLSVLDCLERNLAYDLWTPQGYYIEVWVEKDAQVQVIERACSKYRVPYMPCRGYMSWSEIYAAGNRFREADEEGKQCLMVHLGDHDPSGWDMTRDNEERIALIAGFKVPVERVALMTSQVKELGLPPQPAKVTDKRFQKYLDEYGPESWELDALRPKYIQELISTAIEPCISDKELWQKTLDEEAEARKPLALLHERWKGVKSYLNGDFDPPEPIEYFWE
jgi:hypothetical protein